MSIENSSENPYYVPHHIIEFFHFSTHSQSPKFSKKLAYSGHLTSLTIKKKLILAHSQRNEETNLTLHQKNNYQLA